MIDSNTSEAVEFEHKRTPMAAPRQPDRLDNFSQTFEKVSHCEWLARVAFLEARHGPARPQLFSSRFLDDQPSLH
eukprot:5332889-Amphidinium_carterae.1